MRARRRGSFRERLSLANAKMSLAGPRSPTFHNCAPMRVSIMIAALGLLLADGANGQAPPQSPSDLVSYLTYQSGRKFSLANNGCAPPQDDRRVANSLLDFGVSALPEIEKAFDLIEQRGEETHFAFNSRWLLFVYAHIKGPAAYQRLRAMIDNPLLGFLRLDLDNAVALSLGLTSYVSPLRAPTTWLHCLSAPRRTLDELVLGWERDDRVELEEQLGPRARASLNELLGARSWAGLRSRLWHAHSGSDSSVGYRFDISDELSQAERSIDQTAGSQRLMLFPEPSSQKIDLRTRFVNRVGVDCGRRTVRFILAKDRMVVDDADMQGLLRTISACAAR